MPRDRAEDCKEIGLFGEVRLVLLAIRIGCRFRFARLFVNLYNIDMDRDTAPLFELAAQLTLLGVVGAISPFPIMAVILLLSSVRGLAKGASFAVGSLAAVLGLGFLLLEAPALNLRLSLGPTRFSVLLNFGLALLFLVFAIVLLVRKQDPDAAPPRWMRLTDKITVLLALVIGFLVTITNLKLLSLIASGVADIVESGLPRNSTLLIYVVFALFIEIGLIAPVLYIVVRPKHAAVDLERLRMWLQTHNQKIMTILYFVLAAMFFYKGISKL
jgi:hypothetical protein